MSAFSILNGRKILPKKSVTATALVLLMIFAALIIAFPIVKAGNVPTYAFIVVAPNPIGVGQTAFVEMFLSDPPPTAAGAGGDRWQGFMLNITKPDGTVERRGPFTSDDVGGTYTLFIPQSVGVYTFQFSFPGQTINATGNYYQPSVSKQTTLTVQQEQLPAYPTTPLPTGYWARPINGQNRDWNVISGNWLMSAYNQSARSFDAGSAFAPYTKAPNSPHIVWTKQGRPGGLAGGEYGSTSYYSGMSYEQPFNPPIIINGLLYYNSPNPPFYGFTAVDIRTGETLWYNNGTAPVQAVPPPPNVGGSVTSNYLPLTLGQIYDYESPNQHGAIPYLWSIWGVSPNARYDMYDARTGNWILSIVNGTTGTPVFGDDGSLLVYVLNPTQNSLLLWNASKAIPPPFPSGSGQWQWRPGLTTKTINWRDGIEWNTSVPAVPVGTGGSPQSISKVGSGIVLATAVAPDPNTPIYPGSSTYPGATFIHVGYDANNGQRLWIQNRTNLGTRQQIGPSSALLGGVYTAFVRETLQWYGYSTATGNQIWGPTDAYANNWGFFSTGTASAYGKFYTSGYDGAVHAFNLTTGEHLWDYNESSAGFEAPYGQYPFYGGLTVADGKIYAANGEHSPSMPLIRGESLQAINAETGQGIWKLNGWFIGNSIVISDGYLIGWNVYDNRIYGIGKGQTSTTVSVTASQIGQGAPVGITGTVLDQSPAQPNTPAVSDAIMGDWMAYLNMQQPRPANVTGVTVKLQAIRSDGTIQDIGQTTSDANGVYRFQWTPSSQDLYEIVATFSGSESYWESSATTVLMVGPPSGASPSQSATPTTSPTPAGTSSASPSSVTPPGGTPIADYYLIAAAVVIIIVVAAAAAILSRRRR